MERCIIDERTGWEYELKGEQYYLTGRVMKNGVLTPNEIPEYNEQEDDYYIGVWGQRHFRYIQQHKKNLYFDLFVSGRLNAYLAQIDHDAQEMFDLLVRQLAKLEGVTETLKAENQMDWIQRMNDIRNQANEIVNSEIIYTKNE